MSLGSRGRSRMCPTDDSTTKSSPRKRAIVRALAGDSTITRGLATGREVGQATGRLSTPTAMKAAVALSGALANLVGSWIAWGVGYRGGRPLVERWGRYVLLRRHHLDRAEAWFDDHGEAAVFVSRLLPVVRTFISLPAGIAEMPFLRFSLYTFLGCLPWTFALTALGYALGSQWQLVEDFLRPVSIVIAVLVVAAAAWWLYRRWREQRRPLPTEPDSDRAPVDRLPDRPAP